jgi:hypothetical protein
MKIYYVIDGDHVDPNDKKSLIKSSKKIHVPCNEDEANKYTQSSIAKNIDNYYHRAWVFKKD